MAWWEASIICAIAVACIALVLLAMYTPKGPEPLPVGKPREGFRYSDGTSIVGYRISNMFPNHAVKLKGRKSGIGPFEVIIDHIAPKEVHGISKAFAEEWFKAGAELQVWIKYLDLQHRVEGDAPDAVNAPDILWTTYRIDTPMHTALKSLYIGQVTSRSLATPDNSVGANAVGGMPWVRIHNLTQVPLVLNHGFEVPPMEHRKYLGFDHMGVRLGTIFIDRTWDAQGAHYFGLKHGDHSHSNQALYPDFQIVVPVTDIYYGVVSDLQQPLYGGWMVSNSLSLGGPGHNFEAEQPWDDPDEPHHLLYEGHY